MRSSIALAAAFAAPFASAALVTASSGGAVIINQCGFDIPLNNVPAMKDGVENAQPTSTTLAKAGGTYKTPWVQLLSGGGWSMKLDPLHDGNLMQYEYTYMPDGKIWFDMSYVGVEASEYNKFPSWGFDAPVSINQERAYTTWSDDTAMQTPVASDDKVTLILCTGSDKAGGAPATYAAPTTTEAPPAPTAPTTLQTTTLAPVSIKKAAVESTTTVAPTTAPAPAPAPTTTPAPAPAPVVVAVPADADTDAVVVTQYETKIVTAVVTAIADQRRKRHAHGHRLHGHPQ